MNDHASFRRLAVVVLTLLLGLLSLELPSTHGFVVSIGKNTPHHDRRIRVVSSPLNALDVPLDPSTSGGGGGGYTWTTRQNRIHRVLEKAKTRTGLEILNSKRIYRAPLVVAKKNVASIDHQQQLQRATTAEITLPFTLPQLSAEQVSALHNDEIVIEQSEMGTHQGSGFVVQDVLADAESVWEALLDFEAYQQSIHTVRSARIVGGGGATDPTPSPARRYGTPSTTRAQFDVSRFRLTISCVLRYHPDRSYMEIALDDGLQQQALQSARGHWYTECVSGNRTRVWLLCDLTVSPLLPKFLVDCAATSAMPRASSWLRPTVAARAAEKA